MRNIQMKYGKILSSKKLFEGVYSYKMKKKEHLSTLGQKIILLRNIQFIKV